ncbi:MAG: metallophosphoesterase [Candidatus Hodarchaeota archaeon]
MRLLVISDYHGHSKYLNQVNHIVNKYVPDGCLFCGDIAKGFAGADEWLKANLEKRKPITTPEIQENRRENTKLYIEFFEFFESINLPLFSIPGNLDAPYKDYNRVIRQFKGSTIINDVHCRLIDFDELRIIGFGGELYKDIGTVRAENEFCLRNSENKVKDIFKRLLDPKGMQKTIMIFHQPPKRLFKTENEELRKEGESPKMNLLERTIGYQKGSQALDNLIDFYNPIFVCCGHTHKARLERSNLSSIINPGALMDGCYGLIDTSTEKVNLKKW